MSRGKSFLAVLCSAILLLPINLNFANAAVKAGDACPKLKTTSTVKGLKYTCVKSGNKLVWSKGVKVAAKPTPKPSPTATPAPAPVVLATPAPVVTPMPTPTSAESLEIFRQAAIANNTYYVHLEGCQNRETNAELQAIIDGNWKRLTGAMGWVEVNANCPATHPVQPWAVVDVPEGTTLRWRYWVSGSFDFNSRTFTSLTKKSPLPAPAPAATPTPTPAPVVTPSPVPNSGKKKQTLAFLQPKAMTVGQTQELDISLTSRLIPNTAVDSATICSLVKWNSVTALKEGVCRIAAIHFGNSEFSESNRVIHSIVITSSPVATPTPVSYTHQRAHET